MYAYENDSMRIRLSADRRAAILAQLESLFLTEFDAELSAYRAERILDFFVKTLGPPVYNQAIQDAREFMLERLDDLDSEFYEEGGPT